MIRSARTTSYTGSACGKVILLGEHAVVHGCTALAASLGQAVEAVACDADQPISSLSVSAGKSLWRIEPDSDLLRAFAALLRACDVRRPVAVSVSVRIPTRSGLGSSAAMGAAIARALLSLEGHPNDPEPVANVWEQVFHGNPSGIDVAVAVRGGCLAFSRAEGSRALPLQQPIPLCIGQAGPRASTWEMVDRATQLLTDSPSLGSKILQAVAEAVRVGEKALVAADWATLGAAMDANQRALQQWGLCIPAIDRMCESARKAGAIGAKLTGAGGGGCVIALAPGREDDVLAAWRADGRDGFVVRAGG